METQYGVQPNIPPDGFSGVLKSWFADAKPAAALDARARRTIEHAVLRTTSQT